MITDFSILFSGFVIIFIIINSYYQFNGDMTYVTLSNGHSYLVRNVDFKGKKSKEHAAQKLDMIRKKLKTIIDYMKKTYPDNPATKRIIYNFNEDNICESTPDSSFTSYSYNKGEKLVFCIRNKKTNNFIDNNTITFVAIHELAHVMTKSIGHGKDFWNNMSILLCISKKIGVYKLNDYKTPVKYCGTQITSTPLKCENESCNDECKVLLRKFNDSKD